QKTVGAVRPRWVGNSAVILVVRLIQPWPQLGATSARHVKSINQDTSAVVARRHAGQRAGALAANASNPRAQIPPSAMLHPEAGRVAVLSIQAVDGHAASPADRSI